MTVTEAPPEIRKPEKPAPPAEPLGPSTRTVVATFTTLAVAAGGVLLFVAGGWLFVAGAAVVGGGGAIAVTRAVSKARNAGTSSKPGLLTTLLTRPRKTRTSRTTTRSGLPGIGTGRRGGTGTGRTGGKPLTGRGGKGRQLPALTGRTAAKRATTAAGSKLGKATQSRAVPKAPSTAKKTAAPLKARPGTPSRTPAKASARKPLTSGTTRPKLATTGPKATSRRLPVAGKPTTRPAGTGRRSSTGRTPVSNGGKGAKILPFKRPAKKATGGGSTGSSSAKKTGSSRRALPKPSTVARRATAPLRLASGKAGKLGTGRRGGRVTQNAKRLGRLGHATRGPATRIPNRTRNRPSGRVSTPTPKLLRNATRLPKRTGWRINRPTKAQQQRARRILQLRSRIAGRRILGKIARAPRWLGSWGWNARPAWLWPAIPQPIAPELLQPNVPDPTPTPEPRRVKHRAPVPQLVARRAAPGTTSPKEIPTVSSHTESVVEAFAHLGNSDPENATAILELFRSLPTMFEQAGQSIASQAERYSSEQPIQAPVIELFQAVAGALAGLGELAEETRSTFEQVHAEDIARMQQDRGLNNETAWDVSQQ